MNGYEAAKKWIDLGFLKKRKTINTEMSSYGLKHVAEEYMGIYIKNEEFIKAMIDSGYKAHQTRFMRQTKNPNCFFNISLKGVKA